MAAIAFFEGRPRIFVRQSFSLGLREWDHASRVVAQLPLMESRCGDIPAEISAERRFAQYHWNAAKLVSVRVHLWCPHGNHTLDVRRQLCNYASAIRITEFISEVVIQHR